jgi:hypothetical protein
MSPSPEDDIAGLRVGDGGWVTAETTRGARLHVRFELTDPGRLEPVELHLSPAERIDSAVLRRLPVASLTAMVNAPGRREEVTRRLDVPGRPTGLAALVDAELQATIAGLIEMAGVIDGRLGPVPRGRPKPDGFYRRVADAYLGLAVQSNRPAATIAAVNGVPVSSVHGWVKEARRRGFLPPGQKGRRG